MAAYRSQSHQRLGRSSYVGPLRFFNTITINIRIWHYKKKTPDQYKLMVLKNSSFNVLGFFLRIYGDAPLSRAGGLPAFMPE